MKKKWVTEKLKKKKNPKKDTATKRSIWKQMWWFLNENKFNELSENQTESKDENSKQHWCDVKDMEIFQPPNKWRWYCW